MDGSPCLSTPTRSVIDVAWEATEQLEGTLRRLIDAAPPKSGAQAALKDAMIAVRENVLDALHELRMAKDERDEEDEPRRHSTRDVANYETEGRR